MGIFRRASKIFISLVDEVEQHLSLFTASPGSELFEVLFEMKL